jgi:orotate phosphoribosyltransferase
VKSTTVAKKLAKWGGSYVNEHFVFTSGKHGDVYANFDVAFPHIVFMWRACQQMVKPFRGEFDVIVAPATGGVALAYVAALTELVIYRRKVKVIWADKGEGKTFFFERQGFAQVVKGKRVLVLDDVMTNPNSDGSVYKLCRLVEEHGGEVVGVSIVCNRCDGTAAQLDVPRLEQLYRIYPKLGAMSPEDCSLCADNVPIVTDIGHGADFQEKNPDYAGGYKQLLS